jgi:hypothetical protein
MGPKGFLESGNPRDSRRDAAHGAEGLHGGWPQGPLILSAGTFPHTRVRGRLVAWRGRVFSMGLHPASAWTFVRDICGIGMRPEPRLHW